jgi:arylsulfatase A-like enzyme
MNKKQPNILFFFPDQFRSDWVGINSCEPVKTPNIDRLAKNGVLFNNAYTPSPLCAPARACLASGRAYMDCRVPNNSCDYQLELPTYYQLLRNCGYNVAGVGKFDLHKDTSDIANLFWGLDGSRLLKEWGFTHGIDNEGKIDGIYSYTQNNNTPCGPYLNFLHQNGMAEQYIEDYRKGSKREGIYINTLPEYAYCDNWLADNGMNILEDIYKEKPWHMVINFTGPHNPMDATQSMRDKLSDISFSQPFANNDYDKELEQERRQNYAAMIESIDNQVGRYIQWLEKNGQLDNTIVIFSSDHGEMLGDHSRHGKCSWYEASVKIPLIISGPGISTGVESDSLVSIEDITATILEYTGAETLPDMDGKSLSSILSEKSTHHRDYIHSGLFAGKINWKMTYDGQYKYVNDNTTDILYDLNSDPQELKNVASANKETVERLKGIAFD